MNMRFHFVFLACLACGTSFAADKNATFPEQNTELRSPNGEYVLINTDYDSGPFNHALTIRGPTGLERRVYTYDRHVSVFWSPKSDFVVINDRKGSDLGTAVLIVISNGASVDLMQEINKQAGSAYDRFHHLLLTAERWMNSQTLLLRLTGYGETMPREFEHWYSYGISGKLVRIKKPRNSRS